jgi:hypothetical protein
VDKKARLLQRIVELYYSAENNEKEIEYLKRENALLYEHVELLKGVAMLIATKQLLPSGEVEQKKSRLSRAASAIAAFLHFGKSKDTK